MSRVVSTPRDQQKEKRKQRERKKELIGSSAYILPILLASFCVFLCVCVCVLRLKVDRHSSTLFFLFQIHFNLPPAAVTNFETASFRPFLLAFFLLSPISMTAKIERFKYTSTHIHFHMDCSSLHRPIPTTLTHFQYYSINDLRSNCFSTLVNRALRSHKNRIFKD